MEGSARHVPSQQGVLLTALGADADTSVEEFAAIPRGATLFNPPWERSVDPRSIAGQGSPCPKSVESGAIDLVVG